MCIEPQWAAIHQPIVDSTRCDDYPGTVLAKRDFHLAACRLARMPVLARLVDNLWLMAGPVITSRFIPSGFRCTAMPFLPTTRQRKRHRALICREATQEVGPHLRRARRPGFVPC